VKEKRTGEFVGAIIGNIFAIAIVNSVLFWRQYTHGVILASWVDILWAANLSFLVQIAGSLILAFYRPPRLYAFLELMFSAAGLLSVIVFFIVFPLDFSLLVGSWLNLLLRVLMIVGIGGGAIGVIVWLVRFIAGRDYTPAKAS
jgi:hypothetical protein